MNRNKISEIKKQLWLKQIKQKHIAEALVLSVSYIGLLINGKRKNLEFNQWVKDNLNIDLPKHIPRKAKKMESSNKLTQGGENNIEKLTQNI